MNRLAWAALALLALSGGGCARHSAARSIRPPVAAARAERRSVPYEIAANGTVEPINTVDVTAQVSGPLVAVRFHEGDEVTAGQVLFEIDPRPFQAALAQADANLARDLVQEKNAIRDADRYHALADSGFTTDEDYQQKRAAAEALRATVLADSAALTVARLDLDYATIRAPISGRTGGLMLHQGNVVRSATSTLVTINQIRPILVRFTIPADRLPELLHRDTSAFRALARTDATAPAQADPAGSAPGGTRGGGSPAANPPEVNDRPGSAEGVLSFLDNQVDTSTGTVMLKARFPNEDGGLWPGEFVPITLVMGTQADATVIPSEAVLTGQQGTYVFVIEKGDTVRTRPVTVARMTDSLAVIASGLAPGAVVVTDGQLRVVPNTPVEVKRPGAGGPAGAKGGGLADKT